MGHDSLQRAGPVIPAPATADLIARVAAGMANDLVSTIWRRHHPWPPWCPP
ncbi:hypothetical protein MJ575_28605 [Klebsiella pneumoniae]|nr:hypothetical protein MJ575_28605 [Klebsiella pneumoniae]